MTKSKKTKKKSAHAVSAEKKAVKSDQPLNGLKKTIKKIHPATVILCLSVVIYFSITLSCLYQRYIYLEMKEPTDSAAMLQISWSILHGTPFTVSCQENGIPYYPHNFLSGQLMLTLGLFSPLFFFTSSAVPFLIIQALIVSLAAIPLYLLAERVLKSKGLALLITGIYFFNPATFESFEKFGFRVETIFMLAFFAMFYFLEKDNYIWAGVSLLFALLTKHNMIMITFMFGLYCLIFDRKRWRFGVFCLILAVSYYIIGVRMIIYKFHAGGQFGESSSFYWFRDFGTTAREVLVNMLLHPGKILSNISVLEWKHVLRILTPAGFLALGHPIFWVCLPQLVMNALMPDYHSIFAAWHWAVVVPFMFAGIIYSISWLLVKSNQNIYLKSLIFTILALGVVYNFADYNKNVLAADKRYYYKQKNVDTSKIIEQLSIIEPDASVMASGQLLWFFAARDELYISWVKFHDDVDYVVSTLPLGQRGYGNIDQNLMKELPNPNSQYYKKFKVISQTPNLIILKNRNSRLGK